MAKSAANEIKIQSMTPSIRGRTPTDLRAFLESAAPMKKRERANPVEAICLMMGANSAIWGKAVRATEARIKRPMNQGIWIFVFSVCSGFWAEFLWWK